MSSDRACISVLGIAGSLRAGSYNQALLRAAQRVAPDGLTIKIFQRLGEIPLYNEDVRQRGDPSAVIALKEAIRQADALLIATPEYNHSLPGVLKNALDWASRPYDRSPLAGKPAAIVGASSGRLGTVRAQLHLRDTCISIGMLLLNSPQVLVPRAQDQFDDKGCLVDEATRRRLQRLLTALTVWTRQVSDLE